MINLRRCVMKQRSSWIMLGGVVVVTILVGCATVSVPPSRMVEQNDHAGLAAWYQKEAVTLRSKAEEMGEMAQNYETRMTKPKQISELVRHCRNLAERYTKAAVEAEALAQLHAEQKGSQ